MHRKGAYETVFNISDKTLLKIMKTYNPFNLELNGFISS
jgi:hypothetical protein